MSWLFGAIGPRVTDPTIDRIRQIHGSSLVSMVFPRHHYIAAGGNMATCFSGQIVEGGPDNWIGLGCIMEQSNGENVLFGNEGWRAIAQHPGRIARLDGHCILAILRNKTWEFFTDRLGQRTLFWYQKNDEFIFSTKLSWLTSYIGGGHINYRRLGSRWLLANQLSYDSTIKEINRLGPGGHLTFEDGKCKSKVTPYSPDIMGPVGVESVSSHLRTLVHPSGLTQFRKLSLGLSGGLDSRVLLALLLQQKREVFRTHTFGPVAHPDVAIPRRMSRELIQTS